MCFDFIDPLQNHSLFQQSLTKMVRKFTLKKNSVYLISDMGKKLSVECETSMNVSINNNINIYFGN